MYAFMEAQNRLRPREEKRFMVLGVEIWEGFLEEVPIQDVRSEN